MGTKLFWRLYFWWGIRQARKRRLAREAELAKRPLMTNDEYWEKFTMIELIIYNILFWVPYIWLCSLPKKLMQTAIDAA